MSHAPYLFIGWIVIWIANSLSVDSYIRYLSKFKPEQWKKMGKPRGMFFNPSGGSYFAFTRMGFSWKNQIPKYIANDKTAIKYYTKVIFWNKVVKWYLILFFPMLIIGGIIF